MKPASHAFPSALPHLRLASIVALLLTSCSASPPEESQPNIVVIFVDDLGYGDLGSYGSTTIRTPRIDRLAKEGTRFTNFYAQVNCGPSRAALFTGRYPIRYLSPSWSMPASEVTFAELLQTVGYATGCIGKWDLSGRQATPDEMPNAQGCDYYYGPLGANDEGHVTLYENGERLRRTHAIAALTRLYTDKAIEFLKQPRDHPFLLYLSHTMVHSIIGASAEFKGRSEGGLYGDVVEELDFHTGRLLDAIDASGLRDETLVVFASDNGPWNTNWKELYRRHRGQIAWGSTGPLRGGKGSTYEGGPRVPGIIRFPGRVPAGRTSDAIFATIDLLPTFATLAGYDPPRDRVIDGVDQTDLLYGRSEAGSRNDFFYFRQEELQAVRLGRWKLILPGITNFAEYAVDRGSGQVELYDLEADPGESSNRADEYPDIVERLLAHAQSLPRSITD